MLIEDTEFRNLYKFIIKHPGVVAYGLSGLYVIFYLFYETIFVEGNTTIRKEIKKLLKKLRKKDEC